MPPFSMYGLDYMMSSLNYIRKRGCPGTRLRREASRDLIGHGLLMPTTHPQEQFRPATPTGERLTGNLSPQPVRRFNTLSEGDCWETTSARRARVLGRR